MDVGPGDGERAQYRANDVASMAETVLLGHTARSLVFVVDHDDDAVRPEGGRSLDQGHLTREKGIELGVAVVDRRAVPFAVFTTVRQDQVEIGDLPGSQQIGRASCRERV